MNEHRNCSCPASKSGSFQIATDHYSRNFIPTGWKLEYTSLERRATAVSVYDRLVPALWWAGPAKRHIYPG